MKVFHILSLLTFTNDYQLQLILNKSYTKRDYKESDRALKQRHSYYANWARLICICETVEIFVNTLFYKPISSFYHGTNCCEHFNEIYSSLYAPTSMTKSLQVATCYSNDARLTLEFIHDNNMNNNRYFECSWISPWTESTKPLNYQIIIVIIFQQMLCGNPPFEIDMMKIMHTKQDIEEEFIGLYVDSVAIADYIYEAFNHFVKNSHIIYNLIYI